MANKLRSVKQPKPWTAETISTNSITNSINVGDYEGPFSIQIIWENGATVDMDVSLEVSNNARDWVAYSGSTVNITANADSHMYDIAESGVEFFRVKVAVTTGSADFTILVNGKQRV